MARTDRTSSRTAAEVIGAELALIAASTVGRLLGTLGPRRRARLALRILSAIDTEIRETLPELMDKALSGDASAIETHNAAVQQTRALKIVAELLRERLD